MLYCLPGAWSNNVTKLLQSILIREGEKPEVIVHVYLVVKGCGASGRFCGTEKEIAAGLQIIISQQVYSRKHVLVSIRDRWDIIYR